MAEIIIYTKSTCPYCIRARQLLQQKNATFTEISVDNDPEKRREMEQLSNRHTVPQIFINQQHIGGCDDLYALDSEGKLDELLA
ncbi:MAG: glutaredoxin 3 [Legionellales bacterium]|nr:glutaredoxin 3 [Legionellales bacterium]